MTRKRKLFLTTALSVAALQTASAQAPQYVALDIGFANGVGYIDDLSDHGKFVTSPSPVDPILKNMQAFVAIADIVSVNGKPVKGNFVLRGRAIQLNSNPSPGQAIGDFFRGSTSDIYLEIYDTNGTPIGTIMTSGLTGGNAPPGVPPGLFCNMAVTGGTGAFLGAGGLMSSPNFGERATSIQEDPSNRRINGGSQFHFMVYLLPMSRPEVVTTAGGPAVFHADFSPVTATKPARAGEVLVVTATGLGPTRPGVAPGTRFPDSPLQEVNSPVEVTVSGKPAEVVNKIGWPGTSGTYRLDIRVPDGTTPGMAALQVTAAFIPGPEVSIPLQ